MVGDDNSLFLVAGGHGGGQPVSGLYHADMAEQKFRSLDKAGRIGIFASALFHHTRGASVDSLEHGIVVSDIGASGSAYTALDLGGLVGDDIAIQVRQYENLELVSAAVFIRFAVMMSMYQSSAVISG